VFFEHDRVIDSVVTGNAMATGNSVTAGT